MKYRLNIFYDLNLQKRQFLGGCLSLISLGVVYALGQLKGLTNYADANDLVLASRNFGLAHAPGYPLQVLVYSLGNYIGYGWISSLISMVNALLLYRLMIEWLGRETFGKSNTNRVILAAGVSSLTYSLSFTTLRHSLVPEVFSLAVLWILILGNRIFRRLDSKKKMARAELVIDTLLVTLAGFSHQLSLLMGVPLIIYEWHRIKPKKTDVFWVIVINVILGISIIGLMVGMSQNRGYGWPMERTVEGVVAFLSRRIYEPGGSQIETYSLNLNLNHSLLSVIEFGRSLFLNFGYSLILAIVGAWWWLGQRKTNRIWLIYGLLMTLALIFYMKMPLPTWATDSEYFWGSGLRYRMFYGVDLAISILVGFGTYGLVMLGRSKSKVHVFTAILILIVTLALGWSNLIQMRQSPQRGLQSLSQSVLTHLPENVVLMVDGDMIFAFLTDQQLNGLRPDIKVVSTRLPITSGVWEALVDPSTRPTILSETDANRRWAMISVQILKSGKRLFWFNPEASRLEILGVEGNPLYIQPQGYAFEVRLDNLQSETILSSTNFDLSQKLKQVKTHDWWVLGMKGYLAEIHTQLMYYYARLGQVDNANWHRDWALTLASLPTTVSLINQTWEESWKIYSEVGSFADYEVIGADEYYRKSVNARNEGLTQQAEYYYDRAYLLEPRKYPRLIQLVD